MATKQKIPEPTAPAVELANSPGESFEFIAVQTLQGVLDNRGSSAKVMDIVARGLARVDELSAKDAA